MSALTIAVGLRCTRCGGRSTITGDVDPRSVRWKCPHHGDDRAGGDPEFADTGIGYVGAHFDVTDRVVFRVDEAMVANERGVEDQDFEVADDVMFEYLFRMELEDDASADVAADYDVRPSTVRDGAMRARRRLGL